MHELSIANSLVDIATEHVESSGAAKVTAINLQIGALSCVHQSALEFSFELVTKDTILEGARLNIETLPVTIYCQQCEREIQLSGIQSFRCSACATPSADIRQGRELEVVSIEISEHQTANVS